MIKDPESLTKANLQCEWLNLLDYLEQAKVFINRNKLVEYIKRHDIDITDFNRYLMQIMMDHLRQIQVYRSYNSSIF